MVAISPLPVSPRQVAAPVSDGIARDPERRSSELAALLGKIESYGRLPSDWAGPGSVVPATVTIIGARSFASAIPTHLPLPQVAPAADGEIGLSWYPRSGSIHASFFDDGSLV